MADKDIEIEVLDNHQLSGEDIDKLVGADAISNTEEETEDKKQVKSSVFGNKTIEDVIAQEAREEADNSYPFSLSRTLGGVILTRAIQSQIGLVLLVCVFIIIYISNGYVCQQKVVEISRTERQLIEARYKATVCTSILTEKSRESNIMSLLKNYGDSTLTIPVDPPYLITIPEGAEQ